MDPTPAGRHLRSAIARAVKAGREAIGWSQDELSRGARVSTGMVALVETGRVNVSVDLAGRLLTALGLVLELRIEQAFVDPRQRDAAHAQCVAYVQRRLEQMGWLVRREVEVVHGRSHGWIDLLAFHPATGALLVIEVKTEIRDIGRIERTLAWYEREARRLASPFGWLPRSVTPVLLILATEVNEERVAANRDAFAQSFPQRGMESVAGTDAALALIDPRSRRRDWLIRSRVDGRRSAAPYRDYADFVRKRRR